MNRYIMTLEELERYLVIDDFTFSYKGKDYFICPLDGVFSTGEFDKEPFDYKTFDDLINDFLLEGKPLKDVIGDIEPH
ncbi:hypothetical protein [Desulfuribacillus alkaliarsenatis]|uniref:Uncharacterized protein n=1 Tax=Desulfuribacillus alkaliarsenatis TaxID=766136 RepID=A0A1E5G242_9FIRM|nr:hypothetical protein [Desulfuribacillus alkaliarsenatis]OEF97045.1 hypothetical protein BHF68_05450 [Desulfuribacillus alkaliarsenatis]